MKQLPKPLAFNDITQEQRITSRQPEMQYKTQLLWSSKETKQRIVFQADNPRLYKSNNGAMNKCYKNQASFSNH